MAHITNIKPGFVHDFALMAMSGMLANKSATASVVKTANRKHVSFFSELSYMSYEIAEAMVAEADSRS